MKLNVVPALSGILWVRLGIKTFWRQPVALSGLFFMFMALLSLLSVVPYVGNFLALMLLPASTLGLMAAAREANLERFPMPSILISGFTQNSQRRNSMLTLGLFTPLVFLQSLEFLPFMTAALLQICT